MKVSEEEKIHGAVIRRLLLDASEAMPQLMFKTRQNETSRSSYHLEVLNLGTNRENTIGLFVKFSTARRSPWRFNFNQMHKVSIDALMRESLKAYVVLVSVEDGVACITDEQLEGLIDLENPATESIQLKGKHKESYRISGSEGKLERPLPRNSFPQVIIDLLAEI